MRFSEHRVGEYYKRSLFSLVEEAHKTLRKHFTPGDIQTSRLLSIKTGGCPEDCAYCPQAARYHTGIQKHTLLPLEEVLKEARKAKKEGATRFCMGAAWREVKDGPHFERVLEMVTAVKKEGLQVCCTLGMLSQTQAHKLKTAGLYAYNHNIDTSEAHYRRIISTRTFDERLKTLAHVRKAGITVCTGGILGMGESDEDRIAFLYTLANMDPQPESVTVNMLVPFKGTPLEHQEPLSPLVVLRVVAVARLLIPRAVIRLSAGRLSLSHTEQFLIFFAGANSLFLGDTLLTSPNPDEDDDRKLFEDLALSSKLFSHAS